MIEIKVVSVGLLGEWFCVPVSASSIEVAEAVTIQFNDVARKSERLLAGDEDLRKAMREARAAIQDLLDLAEDRLPVLGIDIDSLITLMPEIVLRRLYGGFLCTKPNHRHVYHAAGDYDYLAVESGQQQIITPAMRRETWQVLFADNRGPYSFIGGGPCCEDAPVEKEVRP